VTEPMQKIGSLFPVALYCALLALPAARAQQAIPESLQACGKLRRDSERLACFDRVVADLQAGKTEATASPETMFGASTAIATPPTGEGEAKRDELQQITAQVVSLKELDDGALLLVLDNNQVWRQQDSDARITVKNGDSVTISRASLGTFRIMDTRGRSARFKRVR
jgi:hypothetical protein